MGSIRHPLQVRMDDMRALVNASEMEIMVALEDLELPQEEYVAPSAPVAESAAVKARHLRCLL